MYICAHISAVNFKGIWPRREPKAWAVQRSCGGGSGALFVNLAEAAASAASMQFTALTLYMHDMCIGINVPSTITTVTMVGLIHLVSYTSE